VDGLRPLPDTPGAEYLARRGIPAELARAAGARYSLDWYGRPAVVFPVRDLEGRLVAAQGRHTDGRDDPKARSAGPIGAGLFSTPDALDADPVILAEAPIDALSLAAAGYPAVALCGTALRPWMPPVLSWRRVLLAFDADEAGDKAAAEWTAALRYGTRCERLRPEGAKDWNALLLAAGPDALRECLAQVMPPPALPTMETDPFEEDTDPIEEEPPASDTGECAPIADPLAPFAGLITRARSGSLPPGPMVIGPGLCVADPATFVLATAREVETRAGSNANLWRAVVQERLAALQSMKEALE